MYFEYSEYYNATYEVPLRTLIICLIIISSFTILFCLGYGKTKWTRRQKIMVFIIPLFFVFPSIFQLKQGLKIADDNVLAVETTTGTITQIIDVRFSPRYYHNGKATTSDYIIIDGESYYIMSTDGFYVGQEVTIEYLEHSKTIVKIEKLSD